MTEKEMLDITSILFDGMGYDFEKLKEVLYFPSPLKEHRGLRDSLVCYPTPTEESISAYHNEIEAQIRDIERKRNISFKGFEKDIIRADMAEYEDDYEGKFAKYAKILFLVLAAAGEDSYHPKVDYQYKHPSKEQKKLIQMMLYINPNNCFRHEGNLHSFNPYGEKKPFSFTIGGYEVKVDDYEHQKQIYKILEDEYRKQGLNQCFPYGEEKAPDPKNPFSVTRYNLEKQINYDGRCDKTKQHWKRDLAYRIHFLKHTERWFDDELRKDEYYKITDQMTISLPVLPICRYTFTTDEADLIGRLFQRFGIYDGVQSNQQRILSLISGGSPKEYFLSDLITLHPLWKDECGGEDE